MCVAAGVLLCLITGVALHFIVSIGKHVWYVCHSIFLQLEKFWNHLPRDLGAGMGSLCDPGLHHSCYLPCITGLLTSAARHLAASRQEVLSLLALSSCLGPCWAFQVQSRPERPQPRPVTVWLHSKAGQGSKSGAHCWIGPRGHGRCADVDVRSLSCPSRA